MQWNLPRCEKCGWKASAMLTNDEAKKFQSATGNVCQECKKKGVCSEFRWRRYTMSSSQHRKE